MESSGDWYRGNQDRRNKKRKKQRKKQKKSGRKRIRKTNKRKEKWWKLREWQKSGRFGMRRKRPQNQR